MRVGIVGCGNIAAFHLPHIVKHKQLTSVSVADTDIQRAQTTARRYGITSVYDDFETMLAQHNLDVVHILTPPATHAPLAIKALDAGCHVLVEKPMALTPDEAERMVAAAHQNGVKLCVDHNFVYDPLLVRARELVQQGRAGRVLHVEAFYGFDVRRNRELQPGVGTPAPWILSLPAGVLLDLVPHPLSILLNFIAAPLTAWAIAKSGGTLPDHLPDELRALIDGGDTTGSLAVSLGTKPDCFTVTIYATDMTIHVNLSNMTLVARRNRNLPKKILRSLDTIEHATQLLAQTFANAFKVLVGKAQPPGDVGPVIDGFYRSIVAGGEPPVTGEQGKVVVEVMHQILRQIAPAPTSAPVVPPLVKLST